MLNAKQPKEVEHPCCGTGTLHLPSLEMERDALWIQTQTNTSISKITCSGEFHVLHISVYCVHFNLLPVKHQRKHSASELQNVGAHCRVPHCLPAKVANHNLSEALYVPYPLPIYSSVALPRLPAKVTLPAVTEDVHDLSSGVLCPLIKHHSFLPGGTQEASWTPSLPSTCQFPLKRSKVFHQEAAIKTKNQVSSQKRLLKECLVIIQTICCF